MLWALGLGYFVFDDVPDALSMLGILIVTLSGLYTFYREHSLAS